MPDNSPSHPDKAGKPPAPPAPAKRPAEPNPAASRPMTEGEKTAYLQGKEKGRAEAMATQPYGLTTPPPDVMTVRLKRPGFVYDLNDVLKLALGIWGGLCLFALTLLAVSALFMNRVAESLDERVKDRLKDRRQQQPTAASTPPVPAGTVHESFAARPPQPPEAIPEPPAAATGESGDGGGTAERSTPSRQRFLLPEVQKPPSPAAPKPATRTLYPVRRAITLATSPKALEEYDAEPYAAKREAMVKDRLVVLLDKATEAEVMKEWESDPVIRVKLVDGPRKGELLYCRQAHLKPPAK